ncbi:purine and uridine phosphorylase [Aspergillus brunneoviolaceus CBS 621.78]|uniref:Purine and uridine phosphorylase n=1 Tax=Aspergillus brunneoviolaceus CBS 621.78 TaxID=1450534 RepID=A0ACD1GJR0_9EURO|nr:purine and uridine phosphorylase [Aspergillus brunneoviolaceus CBS 621.78]RAH49524.1 purine and uridine phosphorylase [Aspergillus brunneoviolaceus CBS 621.78]
MPPVYHLPTRDQFQIAIICALPVEADAVRIVLDETYEAPNDENLCAKPPDDPNFYTLGRIGPQPVVLVQLPGLGTLNATIGSGYLRRQFPKVRLALVVGICGAIPRLPDGTDVFLGDVLISEGVPRQADAVSDELVRRPFPKFMDTGFLDQEAKRSLGPNDFSPQTLNPARDLPPVQQTLARYLQAAQRSSGEPKYHYPGADRDRLFPARYRHRHPDSMPCDLCSRSSRTDGPGCIDTVHLSCEDLDCERWGGESKIRWRSDVIPSGTVPRPRIFCGDVGCTDLVMRSGEDRDRFAAEQAVIGFEMEGAGVELYLPSSVVVVKGVCDYADSHKEKRWQPYAALSAACCVKALLARHCDWVGGVSDPWRRVPSNALALYVDFRDAFDLSTLLVW